MCLQKEYSDVCNEIDRLHYKPNPTSGYNYGGSATKTKGHIVDKIFELQKKEKELYEQIQNELKNGNRKAVYGY